MRKGSGGVVRSWRGRHVGNGEAAQAGKSLRDLIKAKNGPGRKVGQRFCQAY